jgi:hypothetical protein
VNGSDGDHGCAVSGGSVHWQSLTHALEAFPAAALGPPDIADSIIVHLRRSDTCF